MTHETESPPQTLEQKLQRQETTGGKPRRDLESFRVDGKFRRGVEVLSLDKRGRPLRLAFAPMGKRGVWARETADGDPDFELESET